MSHTVKPTGSRRPEFRTLEERLWYSRERARLTQQEMADLLGISRKTVQNYEAGVGYPKENRLLLWANATDFDYGWLAGDFYDSHPGARSATALHPSGTPNANRGVTGRSLTTPVTPTRYQFSRNVIVAVPPVTQAA